MRERIWTGNMKDKEGEEEQIERRKEGWELSWNYCTTLDSLVDQTFQPSHSPAAPSASAQTLFLILGELDD